MGDLGVGSYMVGIREMAFVGVAVTMGCSIGDGAREAADLLNVHDCASVKKVIVDEIDLVRSDWDLRKESPDGDEGEGELICTVTDPDTEKGVFVVMSFAPRPTPGWMLRTAVGDASIPEFDVPGADAGYGQQVGVNSYPEILARRGALEIVVGTTIWDLPLDEMAGAAGSLLEPFVSGARRPG